MLAISAALQVDQLRSLPMRPKINALVGSSFGPKLETIYSANSIALKCEYMLLDVLTLLTAAIVTEFYLKNGNGEPHA